MLGCVGATGLGAVDAFVPVAFGESVVVMGAGPSRVERRFRVRASWGRRPIVCVEPIAAKARARVEAGRDERCWTQTSKGTGWFEKIIRDPLQRTRPIASSLGGRDTAPNAGQPRRRLCCRHRRCRCRAAHR